MTFAVLVSRFHAAHKMMPARKYIAAYFARNPMPTASPEMNMPRTGSIRFCWTPTIISKAVLRASKSGVSVEMTKLPTEMTGSAIHMTAAQRPATDPASQLAVRHKMSAVRKCNQGAGIRTAQTSCPNSACDNPMIHAIRGGLVKYPKSGVWLHAQYCASSTPSSSGLVKMAMLLMAVIKSSKPIIQRSIFAVYLISLSGV